MSLKIYFFLIIFYKKIKKKFWDASQYIFLKEIPIFHKKIIMKNIEQILVNLLDHTNSPNFHLSSLDGNTTHKKK